MGIRIPMRYTSIRCIRDVSRCYAILMSVYINLTHHIEHIHQSHGHTYPHVSAYTSNSLSHTHTHHKPLPLVLQHVSSGSTHNFVVTCPRVSKPFDDKVTKPQTLNPQLCGHVPACFKALQPRWLNLNPYTPNPQPSTLNLEPTTLILRARASLSNSMTNELFDDKVTKPRTLNPEI